MTIVERLADIINDEVERRVNDELGKLTEKIAHLYQVPLKIVRRDLLAGGKFCIGVKKNGKSCTCRAASENYCNHHVNLNRPIEPINRSRPSLRHNHPFPSPPQEGCPACEANLKRENDREKNLDNELRDLASLM